MASGVRSDRARPPGYASGHEVMIHNMKRPPWLPQFTLNTASTVVATLIAVVILAAVKGSRHAIADSVRWLAHPVDTPRIVFVLLLALAAGAGLMLLAALGSRLFGARDTPRRRADAFRSAWEKLADLLRVWRSWAATNAAALDAPTIHEQYRDERRSVLEKYARVDTDFRRFLDQSSGWDLREPIPIEMNPSDVAHQEIEEPFERLWKFDNLPATMHWVNEMTSDEFSAWIGRRSDALNAFVTWMRDR
jgi:hypothetical protein